MNQPIHVLVVEDRATDAEIAIRELRRAGFDPTWKQVQTPGDFLAALEDSPDLILSDYSMPHFDGLTAVTLLRDRGLDTPFILISGTIGEQAAVEAMKRGATDYLLKDRMARLGNAVQRALEEKRMRDERHRVEETLLTAETRLRLATQASNIGPWDWDLQTNEVYFSPEWKRQIGYDDDELPSQLSEWESRLHPEDRDRILAAANAYRADPSIGYDVDFRLRHKDGSYRWINTKATLRPDANGRLTRMLGCHVDITERKRMEERLRDSEVLYHSLVENLSQSIFRKDLAGRFTFANQRLCELIGKPLGDLLGKTDADLFPPELAERYRSDDTLVTETGQPLELVEVIETAGGRKRFIQTVKTPLRGTDGRMVGIQGICWDITEKKNLEDQSLRGQRLESLGTLAGGIAHDLNNVLAPILMSIEILRIKYPDVGAGRVLTTIESSAQRGAEMVKQVLTFARGVQGERIPLQIGHIIKEVAQILKQTFPKAIEIRTTLAHPVWQIMGDATQLHQVLMNLCVNARDAMPHGGTLALEAGNFVIDQSFAAMNVEAKPGPYVVLSVKDTGTGIPPDVLERMFEPFFSTKTLEKGTGLGLSTVRGIVKSHGGFVKVSSEAGQGSEFRVYWPATPSTAPVQPRPDHGSSLPIASGEVILVVDDEEAILNIAKQTLETFGYQVLTASDGAQAIALCVQHRQIKLMLTDMIMPIMNGFATIKGVRHIAPHIKIIAATGLGLDKDGKGPNLPQVDAFLQKPYTAECLVKTIHQVLKEPILPESAPTTPT